MGRIRGIRHDTDVGSITQVTYHLVACSSLDDAVLVLYDSELEGDSEPMPDCWEFV